MDPMPKTDDNPYAMIGRLGGAAGTDAQNQARRQNAKRAGRPGRVCLHCQEPVVGGHVDRALDESCGAHGWQWQQQSATPKRHRHATLTCTQAAAILAALPPGTRGGHVLRHALAKLRRAAASADE